MEEVPEEQKPLRADDLLLRRIPNTFKTDFMTTDEQTGVRRPSSGAFEPDEDGVSVYVERILSAYDLDYRSLLEDPLNGAISLSSSDVVEEGHLSLTPDPWPQDVEDKAHNRNAAHALIKGLDQLGKKARKREQRRLARAAQVVYDSTQEDK